MKKTIVCLLLVFSVLAGITACVSAPEPESTAELSTDAAELTKLSAITKEERSLFFRYYYINVWMRFYSSVQSGDDGFDPDISPDAQYYKADADSEPILWSDEIAILAVGEANKTIALYNEALKRDGFELTDSNIDSINQTLSVAQSSADEKGVSLEAYLTDYFGYGFTTDFFKKMLTIEQANFSYMIVLQDAFTADRFKTNSSYEECSELAASDFEAYYKALLPLNAEKFFVDDVYCTDGKAAALECIKNRIAEDNK